MTSSPRASRRVGSFAAGALALAMGLTASPVGLVATAQAAALHDEELAGLKKALAQQDEANRHRFDVIGRQLDDLTWKEELRELADVEIVRFTGPPPKHQPNPDHPGAANPLKLRAYVFIPKKLDKKRRQPLLVWVHGGIHLNFGLFELARVKEALEQGYTIIAPEYRGSSGFGGGFYDLIDYGGLEIDDTQAARALALERYDFLDKGRVGILGWSHGGLHALMSIFDHPGDYEVAFAGMPVSNLVARMGYSTPEYHQMFAAKQNVGKPAWENVREYQRRSPVYNVDKYKGTPLLIHAATNDEDVNILEIEHLVQALKVHGKKGWEYKAFKDAPGGHAFQELDTKYARDARREIWRFLGKHLKPERPM